MQRSRTTDAPAVLQSQRESGEEQLPEKYFLASARFIEKKNLPRLIQAYARYHELATKSEIENRKSEIWSLVLLGDGPLRPCILNLRSSLGLDACVHLPGFN
jgi:glycosyltransferase involved in cell wall biosynthesis